MILQNKKGNIYASIMVALVVFMIGMICINFFKTDVTTASSDLNCAGTPSTDGTKVLCLIVDSVVPYFIVLVLSITIGVVTEKFLV